MVQHLRVVRPVAARFPRSNRPTDADAVVLPGRNRGGVGAQQPPSRVVSASASPYVCEDTLGSLSNRNPWQVHQASCRAEWGRRGLRKRNGMRLRINTLAQLAHSVFEQHGRRLVHDLIYDAGGTSAVLGTRLG